MGYMCGESSKNDTVGAANRSNSKPIPINRNKLPLLLPTHLEQLLRQGLGLAGQQHSLTRMALCNKLPLLLPTHLQQLLCKSLRLAGQQPQLNTHGCV
jgi:hypothetical protein